MRHQIFLMLERMGYIGEIGIFKILIFAILILKVI